jgi:putative NADH-flavin reductase
MKVLVVGATGATGRLLTEQLIKKELQVSVIVRSAENLPESIRGHKNLSITEASLLDLSDDQLSEHVSGCSAVASCLGHNITFKGIFGKPRRLVTQATQRLCEAIRTNAPEAPVRFVLMNTTGNTNKDLKEQRSVGERLVMGMVRGLVPPQPDNEQAAEHLRTNINKNDDSIEWVAVRPDGLINETSGTDYELFESPIRSPIFNAGKTSRINVADFMAKLMTEEDLWTAWKGQMPVIYNKAL